VPGEAAVNRYETLFATADVSVSRFDHPPHEAHDDPDEEVATRWAIAFVQSGSFDVIEGTRCVRLQRGGVLLSRPGLRFSCRHHEAVPSDVCLSIAFEPGNVADAENVWMRAGRAFRRVATPRLAYVDRRLREAEAGADRFQLEQWALAALTALEADADAGRTRGRYAARGAALDAVVATCRTIEAEPWVRRSIAERARDVGWNSARLTRAFRHYLGMAPHAYVIRCRLAAATALLDSGMSVSETCFRSGFENLSHFCRVFRRTLGVRASRWRAVGQGEKRRKVLGSLHVEVP
jgi:AraC-like DNA-binding protein